MRSRWVPRVMVGLFAVACLLATAMLSYQAITRHAGAAEDAGADALEPYFDAPTFELTDQTDHPFSSDALKGHIWIAHFFYSRCTTVCPMVTGQMAQLQHFLQEQHLDDVRMVSFTVDPENDTPQKLAEYAARLDVQPERWVMLTGEREVIWNLVERGFKMAVAATDDPDQPVSHPASLVLVDAQGRVRAFYHDMNDPAEAKVNFAKLVTDIAKLRREAR